MHEEDNISYQDLIKFHEEQKPLYPCNIIISSVENNYLIDVNGKKYLDFASGENLLGYLPKEDPSSYCYFDSGLFVSSHALELEKEFEKLTGLSRSVFTASQKECYQITSKMVGDYLNLTNKKRVLICVKERENYFIPDAGIDYIPLNASGVARSVFTKEVGAVIIQPVQITDSVSIAEAEYLSALRELCDKNNAIMAVDVSSISPLRLGEEFLNFESSIKPDIIMISKGFTQGIPFGAIIFSEKLNKPELKGISSSVASYRQVLRLLQDYISNDITNILKSNVEYVFKRLLELQNTHISVLDVQSYGMMFTIELDINAYSFSEMCLNEGIIADVLSEKLIKLSPPYTIGKEEIDKLINALDKSIDKLAVYDRLRYYFMRLAEAFVRCD